MGDDDRLQLDMEYIYGGESAHERALATAKWKEHVYDSGRVPEGEPQVQVRTTDGVTWTHHVVGWTVPESDD